MNAFIKFVMALSLAGFLIGCEQGPAEEAGEKIDQGVENIKDGVEDTCEDISNENC